MWTRDQSSYWTQDVSGLSCLLGACYCSAGVYDQRHVLDRAVEGEIVLDGVVDYVPRRLNVEKLFRRIVTPVRLRW